jgi:hypothetical protein
MKAIIDGVNLTAPVGITGRGQPVDCAKFALNTNYPNPFNPRTKISYELPQTGRVTVRIFDINGQAVATLVRNTLQKAGRYTIVFDAENLPSGVYFYQLTANNFTQTRKMLLLNETPCFPPSDRSYADNSRRLVPAGNKPQAFSLEGQTRKFPAIGIYR